MREVPKSVELPDEAARPTRDSPRPPRRLGKFVSPALILRPGIRGDLWASCGGARTSLPPACRPRGASSITPRIDRGGDQSISQITLMAMTHAQAAKAGGEQKSNCLFGTSAARSAALRAGADHAAGSFPELPE